MVPFAMSWLAGSAEDAGRQLVAVLNCALVLASPSLQPKVGQISWNCPPFPQLSYVTYILVLCWPWHRSNRPSHVDMPRELKLSATPCYPFSCNFFKSHLGQFQLMERFFFSEPFHDTDLLRKEEGLHSFLGKQDNTENITQLTIDIMGMISLRLFTVALWTAWISRHCIPLRVEGTFNE